MATLPPYYPEPSAAPSMPMPPADWSPPKAAAVPLVEGFSDVRIITARNGFIVEVDYRGGTASEEHTYVFGTVEGLAAWITDAQWKMKGPQL